MIVNYNGYQRILGRIDSELTKQASTDPDYGELNNWWEGQRQYQDLIRYLRHIERESDDTFNIPNNKSLQKYFVPNNVLPAIPTDTLNLTDDEVQNRKDAKEVLESI